MTSTAKILPREIVIAFSESPRLKDGATFESFAEINRALRSAAVEAPDSGAYRKTEIVITFADGEMYTARLDLTRAHTLGDVLGDHVAQVLRCRSGRGAPWLSAERYEELLRTDEATMRRLHPDSDPTPWAERFGAFLDTYAIGEEEERSASRAALAGASASAPASAPVEANEEEAPGAAASEVKIYANGSGRVLPIEALFSALESATLDPRFEAFGNFIEPLGRWRVRFFGNFYDLSHVFRLDVPAGPLADRLTAAIRANQGRTAYVKACREVRGWEVLRKVGASSAAEVVAVLREAGEARGWEADFALGREVRAVRRLAAHGVVSFEELGGHPPALRARLTGQGRGIFLAPVE